METLKTDTNGLSGRQLHTGEVLWDILPTSSRPTLIKHKQSKSKGEVGTLNGTTHYKHSVLIYV